MFWLYICMIWPVLAILPSPLCSWLKDAPPEILPKQQRAKKKTDLLTDGFSLWDMLFWRCSAHTYDIRATWKNIGWCKQFAVGWGQMSSGSTGPRIVVVSPGRELGLWVCVADWPVAVCHEVEDEDEDNVKSVDGISKAAAKLLYSTCDHCGIERPKQVCGNLKWLVLMIS